MQKYIFIRLYDINENGFNHRTVLKDLINILDSKTKEKYTHSSISESLDDSFLGLYLKDMNLFKKTNVEIECLKEKKIYAGEQADYEKSKFAVFAYPISDKELLEYKKLVKKILFKKIKIKYEIFKLIEIGANLILKSKISKFDIKKEKEELKKNILHLVCSSFVSYILFKVSKTFREFLRINEFKVNYFTPNSLTTIPSIIKIFEGSWSEYDEKMKKFIDLNPKFKIFENKPEYLSILEEYKDLESKQPNIMKKGEFNMRKYNDKKVVDFSRPAILSVEEFKFHDGLRNMMKVDEANRTLESVIMELDAISRNNALYNGDDFVRSLEECTWIEEKRRNGKWFGEFEHPKKNCDMDRFINIDDDRICHRILSWRREGNKLIGHMDFKVDPLGPRAWNWISTGSNPSFSVRVYTKNYVEKTTSSGRKYIAKIGKMIPITFDFVTIPGFYSAYAADPSRYDIASGVSTEALFEGRTLESSNSFECWNFNFDKDNFKEFLLSQESCPFLQEAYQIDLSKADIVYTTEGLIMIKPQEQGRENQTMLFPASTLELNRVFMSSESKSRAQKRVKEKLFASIDMENSDPSIDLVQDKLESEQMSAEEYIASQPKRSIEEFDNKLKYDLEKQLVAAAENFSQNIINNFESTFTNSHLKRINRTLAKRGEETMTREDLVDSIRACMTKIFVQDDIDKISKNRSAENYIELMTINGESSDLGLIWLKRNLKKSILQTREYLNKTFGKECLIDIFKNGDFGMGVDDYNKSIVAKVKMRIG